MRAALIATLAALPLALPLSAGADAIDDAIKARQAFFTLLGANTGALAAMAKGEVEYDADSAVLHAGNLGLLQGYRLLPHFPEGSSKEDRKGKTRALPEIWKDLAGFEEKFETFQAAVAGMEVEAGKGRAELGAALQRLGGSCKGCHDDYRAKDF